MQIREIDPEDPVFVNLRQESGKLGKIGLPGFLQRHEHAPYHPPPQKVAFMQPQPQPSFNEPAVLLSPEPEPEPVPEPVKVEPAPPVQQPQPVRVEQIRVKVPPLPPQTASVPVYHKKPVFPQPPTLKPTEPPKVAFVQPAGPGAYAAIPRPTPTAPLPVYVPPQPEEYPDVNEAYNPIAITATKTPRFKAPSLAISFDKKKLGRLIGQGAIGLIMIYFGLTSTGSYFTPASRFTKELAGAFYTYQLGTLVAMVGVVLIYDAIRRAGKV
jgi:hypothetical protein